MLYQATRKTVMIEFVKVEAKDITEARGLILTDDPRVFVIDDFNLDYEIDGEILETVSADKQ